MPIYIESASYNDEFIFLEDAPKTYIAVERLYPKVEAVLSTPRGDAMFKRLVGSFIDKNGDRLKTPGPQYMIIFADNDKAEYFKLFNTSAQEITYMVVEITQKLNGSDFKLLRQNPVFWLFVCVIRYYTLHKDQKGVNTTLAIYALAAYPSIFQKYFKYGVSDVGAMEYTINTLTNKYIIKKESHIFGALTYSIGQSYKFLKDSITDGPDAEFIRFIQRIRNDQNSMFKKICDQYTKNHNAGLTLTTALDTGEDGQIIDSYENDTSQVEAAAQAIFLPMLTNGINLQYVTACSKMAGISFVDTRFFLSQILVNSQGEKIKKFIEAIIFLWMYDNKKSRAEINTSAFLTWAAELFRKTNSNDPNISNIKKTLNEWGEMSGLHQKFQREASRINYKKAIFYYFILSIQYYNH